MLQQIKSHFSALTWNGAQSYSLPSANEYVGIQSLYFKAIRQIDLTDAKKYLDIAYSEDPILTFVIVFNIRDCRGGKGERNLGRYLLKQLIELNTYLIELNTDLLKLIPEYGRWDDLLYLYSHENNSEKVNEVKIETFKIIRDQLKNDLKSMEEAKPCSIMAKWLPNENSKTDKETNFVDEFCKWMHISRKSYRKQLSSLRQYMKVVELLICKKQWTEIEFSKVPSLAMKRLKKAFQKNCPDEFEEWKNKLTKGEVKVCAKQLYPHELVKEIINNKNDENKLNEVSEAQWKVLMEETKKLGTFKKSIVLSDVSGSMYSKDKVRPIDASIALGIMISNCTEGFFNKKVITFETKPNYATLKGNSLYEDVKILRKAPWGGSTNFEAVFDLILNSIVSNDIPAEEIPEKIYVLSDMQFDNASSEEPNIECIKKKFENHNLTMPKLIFWNLNGSTSDFPCTNDHNGLMISGFSTSILKNIMKCGECDNITLIKSLLENERYKPVIDILKK